MAYYGPWGTFIHIPKTGGLWVKAMLKQLNPGGSTTFSHDLPDKWHITPIFTILREPAEWLASVWAHRMREKFLPYPVRVPWQYFCQLTDQYTSKDFNVWLERITTNVPGLVTWFFDIHSPPTAMVFPNIDHFNSYIIDRFPNIRLSDERINFGHNSPAYNGTITEEQRELVILSEAELYDRWYTAWINST